MRKGVVISLRKRFVLPACILLVLLLGATGLLLYSRATPPYEGLAAQAADDGTTYFFRSYGPNAQNAVDAAAIRVKSIDNIVEGFAGCDVERINEGAGQLVEVDPATIYLLHVALDFFDRTYGHFSLCDARADEEAVWGLEDDPGMGGLSLHYADLRAGIADGTGLTLVSLIGAYAADQAASVAMDYGIASGFFLTGDEAVAIGSRPDGGWWTYQIPHPSGQGALGVVLLKDQAAATVGVRGDVASIGETSYLPTTAMPPAAKGVEMVTVVGQSAVEAAALANALIRMERAEGEALLRSFEGAHAVFVMQDGAVYVTPGLSGRFSLRAQGYALQGQ